MELDLETKGMIVSLNKMKLSSRKIAEILGIGKSTVNDFLKKYNVLKPINKPKILFVDLETAAALAWVFGRFDINLTQNHIEKEGGFILVGCYNWIDSDEIHSLYLSQEEIKNGNDSSIVQKLISLYEEADAVVMHNAKKFDHKVIQTRALKNNLGILPKLVVIDTLQIAKTKLRLPSNKLDSIAEFFGFGRKFETGGIELWKKVQSGDEESLQKMIEYCKQDVALLKAVFFKLAPLGIPGFNAALYNDSLEIQCNTCNSTNVTLTGRTVKTSVGEYAEHICHDCGNRQKAKELLNSREKRKTLLT